MRILNPNLPKSPTTSAGPKPMPDRTTMPLPKKPMPLPKKPKPDFTTMPVDPSKMAKGGVVKKGMAYGGMAKAPMAVAKAPAKPMAKSITAMPKTMPKGKTTVSKKGMAMGGAVASAAKSAYGRDQAASAAKSAYGRDQAAGAAPVKPKAPMGKNPRGIGLGPDDRPMGAKPLVKGKPTIGIKPKVGHMGPGSGLAPMGMAMGGMTNSISNAGRKSGDIALAIGEKPMGMAKGGMAKKGKC